MGIFLPMKTINVPIGEARSGLCALLKKVEAGAQICLTSHGEPKALIIAFPKRGIPWRVEVPDDPERYGDLESPVMDDWK